MEALTEETAEEIKRLVGKFRQGAKSCVVLFDSSEDMQSELVLAVLKGYPKFDANKGCLSTFVYAICRNKLRALMRRAKSPKHFAQIVSLSDCVNEDDESLTLADMVGTDEGANEKFSETETSIFIEQIMPYLNKETQMFYLEGCSAAQIASSFGISVTQVHNRIKSCLQKLQILLTYGANLPKKQRGSTKKEIETIMKEQQCSQRTAYRILGERRKN